MDDESAGERNDQVDAARGVLDFIPDKERRRRIVTFQGGATHSIRPAASLALVAESHYATVFFTAGRVVQASLNSDIMREVDVLAGAVGIVPAGNEASATWPSRKEGVAIIISPSALADIAQPEFDGRTFELRPSMATVVDPQALQLASLLRAELTLQSIPNELYVDSIITLFGIHLLRNYSDAGRAPQPVRGMLSVRNTHRIRDYLSENFTTKLSVAELAAVCELSPRHFIQAFAKTFGHPPHQYLMSLRLDFAERLLLEGLLTIAEVAVLSGFSSQSHLTASLKKQRGRTPARVRALGV